MSPRQVHRQSDALISNQIADILQNLLAPNRFSRNKACILRRWGIDSFFIKFIDRLEIISLLQKTLIKMQWKLKPDLITETIKQKKCRLLMDKSPQSDAQTLGQNSICNSIGLAATLLLSINSILSANRGVQYQRTLQRPQTVLEISPHQAQRGF